MSRTYLGIEHLFSEFCAYDPLTARCHLLKSSRILASTTSTRDQKISLRCLYLRFVEFRILEVAALPEDDSLAKFLRELA